MPDYPPEPWRLAAQAYLSVWRVPVRALPRLSDVVTPVTPGGRALVVTAWIDYTPPGRMRYHELLSTVAVRRPHGAGIAGSITEIWVDSAASRAGGRELWGIPKELATFDLRFGPTVTATARAHGGDGADGSPLATATFTPRRLGTPSVRTGFSLIQEVAGAPYVSPVRARMRIRAASARWTVDPHGPLGYLAGHRPVFSAHATDARLLFGARGR
ncbi:acetoacetate decarboxylase family protein [Saccharomonospora halophila]|uniref:acetoacetate decarboxylase family protein n=1 Tax=Saccharomonospora halophila TaxID=129922 RepID=UPI0003A354AC|nr:acetoacetate decarboxylase family protein [Saccharomonospora halophila]